VTDKPNVPMNCDVDCSMHTMGRCFIASVGWVYYWPRRRCDCTPWV